MINLALPYDIILRAGSPFVDKEVINISFSHNILRMYLNVSQRKKKIEQWFLLVERSNVNSHLFRKILLYMKR